MAEFLIKAADSTHPDPEKNDRGCYKRGDIVEVRPDGATYGRLEGLPNFLKVKVTGLDYEKARTYMSQQVMGDISGETPDPSMMTKRRKYKLRVDDIPETLLSELTGKGEVTVTWKKVRKYFRNKATGTDEV